MNVLITGGYGFIGAWIIKALLARDDSVSVFDLQEDPRRLRMILPERDVKDVAFIPGDVCDLPALSGAIAAKNITHIIHLAGLQVPTCRVDPMLGAKVNVLGSLAVFEAARLAKIERVVYASSAAVFGPQPNEGGGRRVEGGTAAPSFPLPPSALSLSDDELLRASTHYGVFKHCNEGNARIYFQDHGLASVGLRPWTVYGVGRDLGMTSEPTKSIKAAVLGRSYAISFGGLTNFQYAADVAGTFVNCLTRPFRGAKSYNLRGAVVTLADFRNTLIRVLPEAEKLISVGTSQIAIAYDLSDTALEADLGPMPKTLLEEGIRETVALFRKLSSEGRLDAGDLETPKMPAVTVSVEA